VPRGAAAAGAAGPPPARRAVRARRSTIRLCGVSAVCL